jgi:hypothetical protein
VQSQLLTTLDIKDRFLAVFLYFFGLSFKAAAAGKYFARRPEARTLRPPGKNGKPGASGLFQEPAPPRPPGQNRDFPPVSPRRFKAALTGKYLKLQLFRRF